MANSLFFPDIKVFKVRKTSFLFSEDNLVKVNILDLGQLISVVIFYCC